MSCYDVCSELRAIDIIVSLSDKETLDRGVTYVFRHACRQGWPLPGVFLCGIGREGELWRLVVDPVTTLQGAKLCQPQGSQILLVEKSTHRQFPIPLLNLLMSKVRRVPALT